LTEDIHLCSFLFLFNRNFPGFSFLPAALCQVLEPLPQPRAPTTDSTATLNKLALATGGTEKSWYRCIFPFGIVSVVIGIAATCITFTINGPQMDIAKVVSVATLIFGVGLLVAAYVCWRAKRQRSILRLRESDSGAVVEKELEVHPKRANTL
uniref:Transmembrane protein 100 n=1 Tax=Cyanistes caeruleus TaxID=156563 RepID=A0A8C0VFA4_CYACU